MSDSLEFLHVSKSFDSGHTIYRDLSLRVPLEGVTLLIGRSGVGKSLLLRLAIGLEVPDAGTVTLAGVDVARCDRQSLLALRRQFPTIPQDPPGLPWLTAAENVSKTAQWMTGDNLTAKQAKEALAVAGIEDFAARYPDTLDLGARKRLALARLVSLRPQYMFFDEPTTGLEPIAARQLAEVVGAIAARGRGALIVTHEPHYFEHLSARRYWVTRRNDAFTEVEEIHNSTGEPLRDFSD